MELLPIWSSMLQPVPRPLEMESGRPSGSQVLHNKLQDVDIAAVCRRGCWELLVHQACTPRRMCLPPLQAIHTTGHESYRQCGGSQTSRKTSLRFPVRSTVRGKRVDA